MTITVKTDREYEDCFFIEKSLEGCVVFYKKEQWSGKIIKIKSNGDYEVELTQNLTNN